MNQRIALNAQQRKAVKNLLTATHPEYSGRKVTVEFTEKFYAHDLCWDGGTKNSPVIIRTDGQMQPIKDRAPWEPINEGKVFEITPQVMVIEHHWFCGHDCGITIFAHPIYAPKLLKEG